MKRIYTDADLYDENETALVIESAELLLGQLGLDLRTEHIESHFELVLEVVERDGSKFCGYYFVDHQSKIIFWLEEFDASHICSDVAAVLSLSHLRQYAKHKLGTVCLLFPLGYQLESQYWSDIYWPPLDCSAQFQQVTLGTVPNSPRSNIGRGQRCEVRSLASDHW